MSPSFFDPPKLTREQLKAARDAAEETFRDARAAEGPGAFHAVWDQTEPLVRAALVETSDLLALTGDALKSDARLWQTLRYFCAPPISEEDLWTVVGKKFKNVPTDLADATAKALLAQLDSRRFPWVGEKRAPRPAERSAAVMATGFLLAHETLKTSRRGTASKKQEELVGEVLEQAGFRLDRSRKAIEVIDEIERGHFSRERKIGAAKCDVPVRLPDGRLLALECKVSNGPKNSWKRLNREVGGKAKIWRAEFGSHLITGAVLAGVFDMKCVVDSQEDGVVIFWQHDLSPLIAFLKAAGAAPVAAPKPSKKKS